jgi:hypothetical protein
MNTIGKILVILNFIFAIAIGVFLVYSVAVRNEVKEKYKQLNAEALALKESMALNKEITGKVVNDYKNKVAELEEAKQKFKDADGVWKMKLAEHGLKVQELEQAIADKNITVTQSTKLAQRLKNEIDLLKGTINDREVAIIDLELKVKKIRADAQNFEAMMRTQQIRNEGLLDQVQSLTKKMHELEAGVSSERAQYRTEGLKNALAKDANPPALLINGKVEDVKGDLVQLSVGSDHGIQTNNTLDVFRLQPEPKYLGMVRITEVYAHASVGRLMQSGSTAYRPQVKVGDQVTSKLTR